ncbi:MAG: DUF3048 domain-containing protein [Halanaerobiales bacterium]
MKKNLLLALLLIMIMVLMIACSSEQSGNIDQGENTTEETGVSDKGDPEESEGNPTPGHSDELAGLFNDSEGDQQSEESSNTDNDQPEEGIEEGDTTERVFNEGDSIYYSPFTGTAVREMYLHKALLAVIENSSAARPQSGLDEASIVYEFLVEGGVTRFLALYWGDIPEKIGPIRSARPYLINVADEYNALLLHAGASPEGFSMLAEGNVEHLDQIYRSRYYWRGSDRKPPHNLYTGKRRIEEYLNTLIGQEYQQRFSFQRLSVIRPDDRGADIIRIPFWGGTTITYKYNASENQYYRYYGAIDIPHLLDNNKQITADNIIIQYTRTRQIDDIGRLEINLNGRGKAVVFSNGVVTEGFWEKDQEEITKFYNNLGERVKLNPGQTWIEIVPDSIQVEYIDESILDEKRDLDLDEIENNIEENNINDDDKDNNNDDDNEDNNYNNDDNEEDNNNNNGGDDTIERSENSNI